MSERKFIGCHFSRGCFECEAEATHVVTSGEFDDQRSGIPSQYLTGGDDDRSFTCPKHAASYRKCTGGTPRRIEAADRDGYEKFIERICAANVRALKRELAR